MVRKDHKYPSEYSLSFFSTGPWFLSLYRSYLTVLPQRQVAAHLAVAQQFLDAGYDHLAMINAGPDPEGFFDFFASELAQPLRKLTPTS